MPATTHDEDLSADQRMLYQIAIQDIAFFKQQQWRIANYALFLDVAVVTGLTFVHERRGPLSNGLAILAFAVATGIALVCIHTILRLDDSIGERRARTRVIEKQLSAGARQILPQTQNPDGITRILVGACVVGLMVAAGFVAFLMHRSQPGSSPLS